MIFTSRYACFECGGDGKCKECFGTGTNTHLQSDESKCANCDGTGVCPKCGGSGQWQPTLDDGLTKLDLE